MKEEQRFEAGDVGLVMPQFSLKSALSPETDIINYKLLSSGKGKFVLNYLQSAAVELFAQPLTSGNLIFEPTL